MSYYNGTRYTFTWEEGRNLVSAAEGTNTYTYAYDSNGLRVSKTVNGIKHEYLYASGRLLRETIYDASGSVTDVLDFAYDWNGQPFSVKYNGATYFYVLNLQGDVVRIVDGGGTSYGVYRYDAWGNILYSTNNDLINANPLRYRGYYYDAETGFYYLQSRYYDPVVCRYLNADTVFDYDVGIPGYNIYAYCGNKPRNRIDSSGADSSSADNLDITDDQLSEKESGGDIYSSPSSSSGGGNTSEASSHKTQSNRLIPNPDGRKGSEKHQKIIQNIKADLESKGYTVKEEAQVKTPGGYKETRFLDLFAEKNGRTFGVQVGRCDSYGIPVTGDGSMC